MRFWDSSALVGLVIQEKESHTLDLLAKSDPDISVWWGTRVEGASAVSRLEREGKLESMEVEQSLQDLIDMIQAGNEIQPSEAIRTSAIRILRMHPLRAASRGSGNKNVTRSSTPFAMRGFPAIPALSAREGHSPTVSHMLPRNPMRQSPRLKRRAIFPDTSSGRPRSEAIFSGIFFGKDPGRTGAAEIPFDEELERQDCLQETKDYGARPNSGRFPSPGKTGSGNQGGLDGADEKNAKNGSH
jgi:hypothetical protein